MWVAASVRGLGLGRRLLAELEAQAAAHGVRVLQLETHRALGEAISLYRTAGYREVEAFNDEPYAHHWFEKTIGAELWVLPSHPQWGAARVHGLPDPARPLRRIRLPAAPRRDLDRYVSLLPCCALSW
jgi:Acetyltransferase (GNAT) family